MGRFRQVGSVNLVRPHMRSGQSKIKSGARGAGKSASSFVGFPERPDQSVADDAGDRIKSILPQLGKKTIATGGRVATGRTSKFVARTGVRGVKKGANYLTRKALTSGVKKAKAANKAAKKISEKAIKAFTPGRSPASLVTRTASHIARAAIAIAQKIAMVLVSAATPIVIITVVVCVIVIAIVSILPSFITGIYLEEKNNEMAVNVPAQYVKYVLDAGSICPEVTASIIAAQIDTESSWNPKAESPAGAKGISQFMPGTWASVGRDGNGDGKIDIFDPADAIISQGHYMCDQVAELKRYGLSGSIDLALAAYNAGISNVISFHGIPPFPETRAYVEKIENLAASKYAVISTGAAGGAGDDYPWRDLVRDANGNVTSVYNTPNMETRYYFGNCTDFVFWRVNRDVGVAYEGKQTKWRYTYAWLTPHGGNGAQWGDPDNMPGWGTVRDAKNAKPGDVISFKYGAFGASSQFGHVAYVSSVAPDGTITTENYGGGEYFVRVLPAAQLREAMDSGAVIIRHNPALGG